MSVLIFYVIGVMIGNDLLDVAIIVILLKAKPTLFGLLLAAVNPHRLPVPKPYRQFNIYFSILMSWGVAIISIAILLGIIIHNKYFGSKVNSSDES